MIKEMIVVNEEKVCLDCGGNKRYHTYAFCLSCKAKRRALKIGRKIEPICYDGEKWAIVPGYDGKYFVSNMGRVKSKMASWEKILKPNTIIANRYSYVTLYVNNQRRILSIHRLVALLFIPNPEGKLEVNHKNGVKIDNRATNLEWCTRKENENHKRTYLTSKIKQ